MQIIADTFTLHRNLKLKIVMNTKESFSSS